MTPSPTRELMVEILRVFSEEGDATDDLFWRVDPEGNVRFYVNCSDFFYWATGDGEPIETAEDVFALRQALIDTSNAEHNDNEWWWPLLYCARRRGMRPQEPYFKGHYEPNVNGPDYPEVFHMTYPYDIDRLTPEQRALFDACGPPPTNRG